MSAGRFADLIRRRRLTVITTVPSRNTKPTTDPLITRSAATRGFLRMNGVFIEEGQQVGVIDTRTGLEQLDLLEDQRVYAPTEIEEKVTSPDSNKKIVEELR